MTDQRQDDRLRGLTFTRQLPSPADPVRGTFVVEQMRATADQVDWSAIVPVAWPLRHPGARVPHKGEIAGFPAQWPRYPVLPRRMLFTTVGGSMARGARSAFEHVVDERAPQFVHAHELYPSGAAAAALAGKAGLPLVVTIHGSDLYSNLVRPEWTEALYKVVSAADAIVCVSPRLADDAMSLIGADVGRVHVIPDVFDDERFSFFTRTPHEGPTRLLSVGRLVEVKGYDVLIHALGELVRSGADVTLRLVGSGRLESDLRVIAVAEGVAERVEFAGALSPTALSREMAAADLYVQPSRREGFGVALVEALATGLPVVATDSGGPADIVAPSSGVLVEPDDVAALVTGLRFVLDRLGAFDGSVIAADARSRFGRLAIAPRLVAVYRAAIAREVPA